MEATQFISSPKFLWQPFSRNPRGRRRSHSGKVVVKASRREIGEDCWDNYNVDESMIVLRKRIKEMKRLDDDDDDDEVERWDWMEWEKQYYVHYNNDVCEAMGLLQNYLLNIRPCLGLGTIALVFFSVIVSAGFLFSHALHFTIWLLSIREIFGDYVASIIK